MSDHEADVQCTPSHHAKLLAQLSDYATSWKLIGTHLGFRQGELSNIEAAPLHLQGAPVSWLSELISQWLEWAPGDQRGSVQFATLNALRGALHDAGVEVSALKLTLEE